MSNKVLKQSGLFFSAKQDVTIGTNRYFDPKLLLATRYMSTKPANGFVRIKLKYLGICGTDIDLLQVHPESSHIKSSVPLNISGCSRLLGHEGLGEVVEIGENNSTNIRVGDWVVPASVYGCGQCHLCLGLLPNQCMQAQLLGTQIDGIFADFADIPIQLCLSVNKYVKEDIDLLALTALEPAATALQACEIANIKKTDRVVVFGAGPIGAYCAMIAKLIFKSECVTVVEPTNYRRTLIDNYVDHTSDTLTEIVVNQQYDVLIEASGNLDNLQTTFRSLLPGGRVILLARSGEPLNFSSVDHMITNQISITGCRGQLGGYMQRTAELYSEGRLPMNELVHCVGCGLTKLNEWLHDPKRIQNEYCKAVISL